MILMRLSLIALMAIVTYYLLVYNPPTAITDRPHLLSAISSKKALGYKGGFSTNAC